MESKNIVHLLFKEIIYNNLHIVQKLNTQLRDLNTDFTLSSYFFGNVKLTKNANPDKFEYSGYGIGLNARSFYF